MKKYFVSHKKKKTLLSIKHHTKFSRPICLSSHYNYFSKVYKILETQNYYIF